MEKKFGMGIGVFVFNNDGKILLGLRNDDAEKASSDLEGEGTWTMPGGKIDFGETLEVAASRELLEETGIDVKPSEFETFSFQNIITPKAQYGTFGLIYKSSSALSAKAMEPDEIVKWEWFDMDNLPSPVYPASKAIIDAYQNPNLQKSIVYIK